MMCLCSEHAIGLRTNQQARFRPSTRCAWALSQALSVPLHGPPHHKFRRCFGRHKPLWHLWRRGRGATISPVYWIASPTAHDCMRASGPLAHDCMWASCPLTPCRRERPLTLPPPSEIPLPGRAAHQPPRRPLPPSPTRLAVAAGQACVVTPLRRDGPGLPPARHPRPRAPARPPTPPCLAPWTAPSLSTTAVT